MTFKPYFDTNISDSPEYISGGKFKFPIDDKLFATYSSLLAEHMPKTQVRIFLN